jgi:hypothetical protein
MSTLLVYFHMKYDHLKGNRIFLTSLDFDHTLARCHYASATTSPRSTVRICSTTCSATPIPKSISSKNYSAFPAPQPRSISASCRRPDTSRSATSEEPTFSSTGPCSFSSQRSNSLPRDFAISIRTGTSSPPNSRQWKARQELLTIVGVLGLPLRSAPRN